MRLCLVTDFETDWAKGEWDRFRATWGAHGALHVVSDPSGADAILVTLVDTRIPYDEAVEQLKRSTLWRRNRDRVFVFDTSDQPKGYFPGLYASLRRAWFSQGRHRTSCYFQSFNEYIDEQPLVPRPSLLFSFQGNATSPVRERLLATPFGRPDVLVERTQPFWAAIGAEETKPFKAQYADTIANSRFVLCPRGNGTSSYRLFETMQSRRVPVIIADNWVPCEAVDWSACSIRVSESDLQSLPDICDHHDSRWKDMASAARAEWVRWFSPTGLSESILAAVRGIALTRRYSERLHEFEWPIRTGVSELRKSLVRVKVAMRRARIGS